ncbi:MAG TPA: hypothetical protein DEH78_27320 [Solibacterales bacterium]|nr:hypothetical protein [Bryobacterales bacterium]
MESAERFTYLIQEPFERALTSIRAAMMKEDLLVPMELDVAARIKRELGIGLAPCRLLFVDCPVLLLEAATLDYATVARFPLHVAVVGLGQRTSIHVTGPSGVSNAAASSPLDKLQARVLQAIEKIAIRQRPWALVG